jgi:hypothetical protein
MLNGRHGQGTANSPERIARRQSRQEARPGASPARQKEQRGGGTWLLVVASVLLLLLAAAQGYVSFRAQYTFIDQAKHAHIPSLLEALGLDTGAVIFALLALSLARRGRRGSVERVLNVACALGSMTMNLLAADLSSPRSVTVWVLPSALYALASDRLIAVVRQWVQARTADPRRDGSPWQAAGRLGLWLLRLVFDPAGTVRGFRLWVLAVVPTSPGLLDSGSTLALSIGSETAAVNGSGAGPPADIAELAPGETKREALIRIYEHFGDIGDPRYGDRSKSASISRDIAGLIGYHPGTARRELARYLAGPGTPVPCPPAETDAKAVA